MRATYAVCQMKIVEMKEKLIMEFTIQKKLPKFGYRYLCRSLKIGLVASALIVSNNVEAAITVEKMLIAERPEVLEKGVPFPILGLTDAEPTFVSVRVYKWIQRPDDQFVLEATDDFSIYPELVRISADMRRNIMIKAKRPLPRDRESQYRIVLREFDRADGTDNPPEEQQVGMGFRVKPQASLPMIVRGPANAASAPMVVDGLYDAPALTPVEIKGGAKPSKLLRVRNPGAVYQRIIAVGINAAAGEKNQQLGYVLPGQAVDLNVRVKSGDSIEVAYVIGPDAKVDITGKKRDDRKTVNWIVQ